MSKTSQYKTRKVRNAQSWELILADDLEVKGGKREEYFFPSPEGAVNYFNRIIKPRIVKPAE